MSNKPYDPIIRLMLYKNVKGQKELFDDPNLQTLTALNLALILQILGVAILVLVDPYIKKENRVRVWVITACISFLLIEPQISANYGDVLYRDNPVLWNTFLSMLGYVIRPVVLVLYINIMGNEWGKKILYGLMLVNLLIHLILILQYIFVLHFYLKDSIFPSLL